MQAAYRRRSISIAYTPKDSRMSCVIRPSRGMPILSSSFDLTELNFRYLVDTV